MFNNEASSELEDEGGYGEEVEPEEYGQRTNMLMDNPGLTEAGRFTRIGGKLHR